MNQEIKFHIKHLIIIFKKIINKLIFIMIFYLK